MHTECALNKAYEKAFVKALPLYEEAAKKRQQEAGKQYGENHPKELRANWPNPLDSRRARDDAAKAVNEYSSVQISTITY